MRKFLLPSLVKRAKPPSGPSAEVGTDAPLLIAYARDEDVRALFELLGMLFKADGSPKPAGEAEIKRFTSIQVPQAQHTLAESALKAGMQMHLGRDAVTARGFQLYGFRETSGPERWLEPLQVLDILLRVALVDGSLSSSESYLIERVRGALGVHIRSYWILRDTIAERCGHGPGDTTAVAAQATQGEQQSARVMKRPARTHPRKDLLARLGLDGSASAEDIRARYRTLVKQCHPDLVMHQGSEQQVRASAVRFCELQEAYEQLRESTAT